jgi:signal transduction histidine kinase/PAS domain-containing protein
MPIVESEFALLRHPRLAALATSAWPAWLWSTDASRMLWANAVGAALFGAPDAGEFANRRFDVTNPAAAQILRLAATLTSGGPPRLERLRGFGTGFGRALTCACSRIVAPDGKSAVLVAAAEPVGPALTLDERARRLFAHDERAVAIFTPDGRLLCATDAAHALLGAATTLSALSIESLAGQALDSGSASGTAACGQAAVERLGEDASRVLVVALTPPPSQARSEPQAPAMTEPEQAPPPLPLAAQAASAVTEPLPVAEPEAATLVAELPPTAEAETAPADLPAASPPPPSPPAKANSSDETAAERRHPLRFVWQMDGDGRFIVGSNEFIELVGPRTMAAFGRLWSEIAAELKLDPENQVARAIATHETWSGVTISWPVDDASERLPVELSGLPVFDRDRNFRGYRGFGVCRDITRINHLARARRERPIGFMAASEAAPIEIDDIEARQSAVNADAQTATAASQPLETPARIGRSPLSVAPTSANVVPFRQASPAEPKTPTLSPVERKAFGELAQELTARLRGVPEAPAVAADGIETVPVEPPPGPSTEAAAAPSVPDAPAPIAASQPVAASEQPVAAAAPEAAPTQQPAAPVIEPALLDRLPVGMLVYRHDSLIFANRHFLELTAYDTLDELAAAGGPAALFAEPGVATLAESEGEKLLTIVTQRGDKLPVDGRLFAILWSGAAALALILTNGQAEERRRAAERALAAAEQEIGEFKSTVASDAAARDKSDEELRTAKREVQKAVATKAEFLTRISHEIRTPLNAIAGFAEVIMAERFGPIGNERYREYVKDIHAAGSHLVSLLNDLLDLSKIETGQLDLTFANVALNDLIQQCVAIMQPQANRARIIIRTALTPALPKVVADERAMRQIVLNLLANSVRFTGPGGQVIVSTAVSDAGEVVVRVRDTSVGMSEKDIEAALEPFRQTATSGSWGSGGTGLGLPLTKALAEANRANFSIKSAPNAGTLIEVAFPPASVVTE